MGVVTGPRVAEEAAVKCLCDCKTSFLVPREENMVDSEALLPLVGVVPETE